MSSATRCTRNTFSAAASCARRARRPRAATSPTRSPTARRMSAVSRSSALSIRAERNGLVRKKSNASVDVTAASAPAARPPTIAATTTTRTRINARFVLSMSSRNDTSSAPTAIGARPPTGRPIAVVPAASGWRTRWRTAGGSGRRWPEQGHHLRDALAVQRLFAAVEPQQPRHLGIGLRVRPLLVPGVARLLPRHDAREHRGVDRRRQLDRVPPLLLHRRLEVVPELDGEGP